MTSERAGALAFATVRAHEGEFALAPLESALIGGTEIVTYGRKWVMESPDIADGMAHGRIGILTEIEAWDEETRRFRRDPVMGGFATPYLMDLRSGRVVFQTRGSIIKAKSFANALEHLLNEASSAARWRVDLAETEMSWEDFLGRVERVSVLTVKLLKPNPTFPNDLGETLVGGAETASTTVTMRAVENGSIATDSDVVAALLEHADRYGQTTATGSFGDSGRVRWRRRRAQVTEPAPADPETGEVGVEAMREVYEAWNEIPFFPEEE